MPEDVSSDHDCDHVSLAKSAACREIIEDEEETQGQQGSRFSGSESQIYAAHSVTLNTIMTPSTVTQATQNRNVINILQGKSLQELQLQQPQRPANTSTMTLPTHMHQGTHQRRDASADMGTQMAALMEVTIRPVVEQSLSYDRSATPVYCSASNPHIHIYSPAVTHTNRAVANNCYD